MHFTEILLFDDISLDVITNSSVFNATINSVIPSKRFEESPFKATNFLISTVTNFYQNFV